MFEECGDEPPEVPGLCTGESGSVGQAATIQCYYSKHKQYFGTSPSELVPDSGGSPVRSRHGAVSAPWRHREVEGVPSFHWVFIFMNEAENLAS